MPSERTATRWLGCTVYASMAKNAQAIAASVAASPSMLSSRLNAFVMPMSQATPITVAATGLLDDLDAHARDEHERRRGALRAELRERRQVEEVVGEACGEEDRAAAEDAAELARGRDEAGRERDAGRGERGPRRCRSRRASGVDRVCQRSARGRRHDVACGGGVQQAPDRQETRRQRGKGSHGDRHGRSVTKRCKKGVWGGRPARSGTVG